MKDINIKNKNINLRNSGIFIVEGLSGAILDAEMNTKSRPGSKSIDPFPSIEWEDASEEMRNNPKTIWIRHGIKKYTFRKHTIEEKREIYLNKQWKLKEEFKYILQKYGWKYAEEFYKIKKELFEEYNVEIDLNIPHCKYTKDGQCDLFCSFYRCGKCNYKKGEEYENL